MTEQQRICMYNINPNPKIREDSNEYFEQSINHTTGTD